MGLFSVQSAQIPPHPVICRNCQMLKRRSVVAVWVQIAAKIPQVEPVKGA
jgi:ribosomal protein L36